jgi:hypothetical protein
MRTPEAVAQDLKTSICAFENEFTNFRHQLAAHVNAQPLELGVSLFHRTWWFDQTRPHPPSLNDWMDNVRVLTTRHGVRVHIADCLTAYLPECMADLRQLAEDLKIGIHLVVPAPKSANHGGKIEPIRVDDALGSRDFRRLSDYVMCVASSAYLAKLKRGKVRDDGDFDDRDIAAANACTPHVEADSHMILAIEKAKCGHPGVYAFAYGQARHDIVFDPGSSMLVRKIWRV